MKQVNIAVLFEWNPVGQVKLDRNSKLVFPETSDMPGLYRLDLACPHGPATYIGEAEILSRRLKQYRNPGSKQATNCRLNKLMVNVLSSDNLVSLATVIDNVHINLNGHDCIVDLSRKADRILLEGAAIYEATTSGIKILNA